MRIVIHDFCGHPFQAQLSRELASRGHDIEHWYCSSYPSGRGALSPQRDDPSCLTIRGVSMGSPFERYSPWKRLSQEIAYARALGRKIHAADPDVVVSCNTPLVSLAIVSRWCARHSVPMTFWQQDIVSIAIRVAARARLGPLGDVIGWVAERVERAVARSAVAVIPISSAFLPVLERWGVGRKTTVIPNWAPLSELPLRSKNNPWAKQYDLEARPVVLYSGTLGLKHDPAILVELAVRMRAAHPDGRVVVVSEGAGRSWLSVEKAALRLDNLLLLDYQPYASLPDVMGTADILLAILEPSAGSYSVPSKILTYLCAGRAVVGIMPIDNAASLTIRASGGGLVFDPVQRGEAITSVLKLLTDGTAREKMGASGRAYARDAFDIVRIATRFEQIMAKSATPEEGAAVRRSCSRAR